MNAAEIVVRIVGNAWEAGLKQQVNGRRDVEWEFDTADRIAGFVDFDV